MSARIAIACACVVVGLAAIVGVATTAGPPDGYFVYHAHDVRVQLPDRFRAAADGEPDVIVEIVGPDRDRVQVTEVPLRGRTLDDLERTTLQDVRGAAPGAVDLLREDVDVPGADEARRVSFHDPDGDRDVTLIIARDDDRFVTLSIDERAGGNALDEDTVEDSFALTS